MTGKVGVDRLPSFERSEFKISHIISPHNGDIVIIIKFVHVSYTPVVCYLGQFLHERLLSLHFPQDCYKRFVA